MTGDSTQKDAIALLQQLGLKEYEAKCFVALTRVPSGTAKEVSELVDVPRTRVYDAIRVLESNGLAEVQHSSPQRFRAVSVDEATAVLREQYETRVETLQETLLGLEPASTTEETRQEVWSLTGEEAIRNRLHRLIERAEDEVVVILHDVVAMDALAPLAAACQREVEVYVGALTDEVCAELESQLPEAEAFVSGLDWLQATEQDARRIDTLLLADGDQLLVSSTDETAELPVRQAVCGRGAGNTMVAVVRRALFAQLPIER